MLIAIMDVKIFSLIKLLDKLKCEIVFPIDL